MKSKNITKIVLSSLTVLAFGATVSAQEIGIEAAGFLNFPPGHSAGLSSSPYGGPSFGINYNQYINDRWSVGLGIDYYDIYFQYREKDISGSYQATDIDGDDFTFHYAAGGSRETDRWKSLHIPLTVQYESGGYTRWYVRTGIAYGLTLGKGHSQQFMKDIETSGYYPQWDAKLEGPDFAGFGSFVNIPKRTELALKNSYSWVLETGIKEKWSAKSGMYVGLFLDMGLNDIRPTGSADKNALAYTKDVHHPLDVPSIWEQARYKDKKMKNMLLGIKLRYVFGL